MSTQHAETFAQRSPSRKPEINDTQVPLPVNLQGGCGVA